MIPVGNQELNSALGNFCSGFSCLLQLGMDLYQDYFTLCSSADIAGLFLTDTVEREGHLLFCLTSAGDWDTTMHFNTRGEIPVHVKVMDTVWL